MRCANDKGRMCGAGWRNNIFKLPFTEKSYQPIYGESSEGCYKDNHISRDLPNLIKPGYGNPSKCFKMAMDAGFQYAGMQYGGECWAGNSVGKYGKRPDKECTMKCKYDNKRQCGGRLIQNIFKLVFTKKSY
jgi:hypothetical protein